MRLWVIQTGEPLALRGQTTRPYRTGLLARTLVERGHEVVYWAATFDHAAKQHTHFKSTVEQSTDGYQLRLLHGRAYTHNVSWRRIVNQFQVSKEFEKCAAFCSPPDLIFCAMPTIELCYAAAKYASAHETLFIVDVRDLWPDIFLHNRGRVFRILAKFPLWTFNRWLRYALRIAHALVAVSEGYLSWALSKAGRERIAADRVFHLGYEKKEFTQAASTEARAWLESLNLPQDRTICWFIGSFGRTYDLRTVIAAAKKLGTAENCNQLHFVLSGRGEDEKELRACAHGLPNITFTGWIGERELAVLMERAHIGLASYGADAPQGLPNKLGEYACAGLAIVSSLGGEGKRVLTEYDAALHYTPGRPSELVQALLQLRDNPDRLTTLRANARRLYLDHFDSQQIYPRMAEFLEGLVYAKTGGLTPMQP